MGFESVVKLEDSKSPDPHHDRLSVFESVVKLDDSKSREHVDELGGQFESVVKLKNVNKYALEYECLLVKKNRHNLETRIARRRKTIRHVNIALDA